MRFLEEQGSGSAGDVTSGQVSFHTVFAMGIRYRYPIGPAVVKRRGEGEGVRDGPGNMRARIILATVRQVV